MVHHPSAPSPPPSNASSPPGSADGGFGDLLHRLVTARGLTMAGFASLVGLSPSTLSRVRTGQRPPTGAQCRRWADALDLDGDDRAVFDDLALLAQTPRAARERLAEAQWRLGGGDRHAQPGADAGACRDGQGFHDGWWLTFSMSLMNDGRIQRSLCRIAGDRASMQVSDAGRVHYRYHGTFASLGDKAFIRLDEDRGGAEYVQITLHSLFDDGRPSFLYGLVCGISGRDLRHPLSHPCAARLLMLHVGTAVELPEGSDALARLEAVLGTFDPALMRNGWPRFLGDADRLRECLHLGDETLDQAILRLIGNRADGDAVLRAQLEGMVKASMADPG